MQLTGKQITGKQIIYNYSEEGVQQQGVDLRVKEIRKVNEKMSGYVPREGKTKIPTSDTIELFDDAYVLKPGYYEVTFEEGCSIPNNATLQIKTRSSLVRCGAICHSGQFDGGFHTENVGCFLHVILPISMAKGARLAQALVFESYEVDDDKMYNGQWQNDKQRNV